MPLFDRYVMVDWSAATKPTKGRDSIWLGQFVRPEGCAGQGIGESVVTVENIVTRNAAVDRLQHIIAAAIAKAI